MTRVSLLTLALLVSATSSALGQGPTLKQYTPPADNRSDEPIAKQFDLQKAVAFLDNAALDWQKKRDCFACHTNYAYLYVRPMLDATVPAHGEIRAAAEAS